jgi:deazaflavin-dependent oxidoreductase (nitroreductase family)
MVRPEAARAFTPRMMVVAARGALEGAMLSYTGGDRNPFEEPFLRRWSHAMTAHRPSRPQPDLRERVAAQVLRLFNPLARRLIAAGLPTGAPNILLTVRGRRSGQPRTVPVGLLELDGRRFVQAAYGAAGWAANLRAAGEATMTEHGRRVPVQAVELPPEEAGAILRRALQPFRRSRLLRALLGPRWRPPVALLRRYRIRVDDTPEEYVAEARRHPLFELRPT